VHEGYYPAWKLYLLPLTNTNVFKTRKALHELGVNRVATTGKTGEGFQEIKI
jgi:hypothetical protein